MTAKLIPCLSVPDATITLMLFSNVKNSSDVRKSVMNGEFEAALLKTSMIVDPFQVIVAANRAVHLQSVNKMMTKNVHSEVLFSLSPSKNISDSFRKFGLSDTDTSVFVAVINDSEGTTCKAITNKLDGQQIDISEIDKLSDLSAIRKIYKINDTELSVCTVLEAIVSRISSKEIVTV